MTPNPKPAPESGEIEAVTNRVLMDRRCRFAKAFPERTYVVPLRDVADMIASLTSELATVKKRLESAEEALVRLADAADSFHNAATAYFTDSTYDGDGILASSEADLSVSALPDARAFLQEQEKQNG